jgi:hypothetical protein
MRAKHVGHIEGHRDFVAEGQNLHRALFGIGPRCVLGIAILQFAILLVKVNHEGNRYTACGAWKRMFLPVFVPDLRSGDYPGLAGYALCNIAVDHSWQLEFDCPTARQAAEIQRGAPCFRWSPLRSPRRFLRPGWPAMPRCDLIEGAPLSFHPNMGVPRKHGARDVAGDAHDDLVASARLGEFGHQRVAVRRMAPPIGSDP